MGFLDRRRDAVLAFASGLVFASSTPPTNLDLGILLGLVGLAAALALAVEWRRGSWTGFAFGLAANLVALRFVPDVIVRFTPLPAVLAWVALVLLSAAQAIPWAVGGAVVALARSRARLPFVLAVATGVYAATFVPAVFPWTPAGGLTRWPALVQTAEIVGERGTTFLLTAACALVAAAVLAAARDGARASARPLALGAALFAAMAGYGALRIRDVEGRRAEAPHARVALLEPDFDAMMRWQDRRSATMLDRLSTLTRQAEASGAVLTVWPESAYPYTLAHGTKREPLGDRAVLQPGVHGPVLTGAYLSKGHGVGTNSAILVEPDGAIGPPYDKRHLLWFGETVPLADSFPILRRIFARGTGIDPGTETVAFRAGPIVATVLNCYEDTLPQAGREAMEPRPNLLVNVTNDAWFAGTAESELHLRLSVLRAIEARRDLVRAVNRGPTTWVSASGRVLARREAPPGLGAPPPLLVDAALLDGAVTPFTTMGDRPLVVLLGVVVLAGWMRRRRPTRDSN